MDVTEEDIRKAGEAIEIMTAISEQCNKIGNESMCVISRNIKEILAVLEHIEVE